MSKFTDLKDFIRKVFNTPEGVVPLHEPRFLGNEKQYVLDTIESTFVSSVGTYVDKLEAMMCDLTGAKHAIATSSGTSALHIALMLVGVKKEEEVITQALSFVATANAIKYCGAEPVFLDVDKRTMGLSVESVKAFLSNHTEQRNGQCYKKSTGKRIAAVVPMHTFGHPVVIQELIDLCGQYNLPVVEDAAESLGSYYKGKHTGRFGKLGVFSFNGNKTITSGGGGMIVTDDADLAKKAKHLTTTAKIPHKWEYVHDEIGYNYRMPNLNAALACAQLEQLEDFIKNKRELAQLYGELKDFEFVSEPEQTKSNYWLNALCLSDKKERDEALQYLNGQGIMCRPIWQLLYKMPMFENCYRDEQKNAQWLEDRIVNVPSSVRL